MIDNHIMCFVKEHKDNLSELGSLLAAGSIPDGAKATQFFNLIFGGFSPSWDDCVRVARLKWIICGFLMLKKQKFHLIAVRYSCK